MGIERVTFSFRARQGSQASEVFLRGPVDVRNVSLGDPNIIFSWLRRLVHVEVYAHQGEIAFRLVMQSGSSGCPPQDPPKHLCNLRPLLRLEEALGAMVGGKKFDIYLTMWQFHFGPEIHEWELSSLELLRTAPDLSPAPPARYELPC